MQTTLELPVTDAKPTGEAVLAGARGYAKSKPQVAIQVEGEYDRRMIYIQERLAEASTARSRGDWGEAWSSITRAENELHRCAIDAKFLA